MKGILIVIVCLVIVSFTQAQKNKFYKATLKLKDGTEKSGLVKLPTEGDEMQLDFKKTDTAEKEKIKSDDVNSFIVTDGAAQAEFVHTNFFPMASKKKSKMAEWFNVLRTGYCTLYSNNFDGFSSHEMINPSTSHKIAFLLKRGDEEVPTTVAHYFPTSANHNQLFRRFTAEYLSDNADIVDRLNKKEFKLEDIGTVVDLYNQSKKEKK
jgi:hypothetical protein